MLGLVPGRPRIKTGGSSCNIAISPPTATLQDSTPFLFASHSPSQGRVCWANGKLDVVEGSGRYINKPAFPIAYEAVAKMNQAKTPRAVVRSAA